MTVHNLIKLVPKTPFHVGDEMDLEHTEDMVHSDTLFSAMCRISDMYLGKANYNNFIQPFKKGEPPFLLSSLFPYIENNGETIYFFPKPYLFKDFVEKFPKNIKDYKKIKYISKDIFDAYLRNDDQYLESHFQDKEGEVIKENLIQGERVWISQSERELIPEIEYIWKQQQEPRVIIDRLTNDTQIFHYGRIHFHENAGLYLLVTINKIEKSKELLNKILTRLRYLGDTGLGGERSTGCGQFEIKLNSEKRPYQINLGNSNDSSKKFITLSLFLPKKREEIKKGLINKDSYYEIINRRGWISNTSYRRKSIKMFSEGSVFQNIKQDQNHKGIYGKLIDITPEILENENPDYRIHRCGYGYPIYLRK